MIFRLVLAALPRNVAEGVVAGLLVELARLLVDYDGGVYLVVGPIGASLIIKCVSENILDMTHSRLEVS